MDRLLSIQEVKATTSLGKTSIYELIRSGKFPRAVRLSVNRVAWRASDVQGWIGRQTEKLL